MESWQTAQMPPGQSPKIISLWPGIMCLCKVMNGRTFQFRSPGKYYLKSLKTLDNSNLQTYPMEFYSVRKCLEFWRGLTNQIFSHKASFGRFFLTPHSSYPKHPSSKINFLKETKRNLRPINFQYWNEMTTKLARYTCI